MLRFYNSFDILIEPASFAKTVRFKINIPGWEQRIPKASKTIKKLLL